ncbi:MAG: pinensin family lanthipeptide [Bacteroidota bacterium]
MRKKSLGNLTVKSFVTHILPSNQLTVNGGISNQAEAENTTYSGHADKICVIYYLTKGC